MSDMTFDDWIDLFARVVAVSLPVLLYALCKALLS